MAGLANINPIDHPQDWDYITLGGVHSPPCTVGEGKRKHSWDIKKGKGAQGATVTYVGMEPMTFSVTFHLWDNGERDGVYFPQLDHFQMWDDFIPLLDYDPTKAAIKAIDLYHPSFTGLKIRSVVTESISNVTHVGKGEYQVKVDFLEYNPPPPKSAVSTPAASDSTNTRGPKKAPGKTPDPAIAALDTELGKALADAKALGPL